MTIQMRQLWRCHRQLPLVMEVVGPMLYQIQLLAAEVVLRQILRRQAVVKEVVAVDWQMNRI